MTNAIDGVGDVGTGAIWARAVEPVAGDAHGAGHGGTCLNCGTALTGRYCHACGQSAHVHRTLMSIVHDLAHSVFHFEGKIWRTLPMLVFHPGRLTRRYIDGERARFVSPLALYLFTVFLMFATFSTLGPGDLSAGLAKGWGAAAPKLEQKRAESAVELAQLGKERAAAAAAGRPVATLDRRIAERRADLDALARVTGKIGAAPDDLSIHSDWAWLDHGLDQAKENPRLVIYKVQSAAYKFSWALIILSTPLVALLFLWRRRFGMYDHATFVTYSITFMSLLFIVVQVLSAIGVPGGLLMPLLLLAPPIHVFAQLRGTYGLGNFSALWRTVALLFTSLMTLTLFVVGIIALEVSH